MITFVRGTGAHLAVVTTWHRWTDLGCPDRSRSGSRPMTTDVNVIHFASESHVDRSIGIGGADLDQRTRHHMLSAATLDVDADRSCPESDLGYVLTVPTCHGIEERSDGTAMNVRDPGRQPGTGHAA